jgi:acetyl esterase/lipase
MKHCTVDLYEYFGFERPEGGQGYLACYLHDALAFIGENRHRPAMIALPGGGYAYCSAREGEPIASQFFAADYQSFVLTYSTAPVRFPAALREAAMAIVYIRENAEALGVNPNEIAAVGFSAGGHLCASIATMFDSPELAGILSRGISARPDAVLLGYPVISYLEKPHRGSFENLCGEDEALRRRLSLETQVTENSAPAFIFHTVTDAAVPVKNSLVFASAYEEKGVPFSMHLYESGVHGLSLGNYITDNLTQNNPPRSADFGTWLPMAITWLSERGFAPKQV